MDRLTGRNTKAKVHIDNLICSIKITSLYSVIVQIAHSLIIIQIQRPLTSSGNII